MAVASLRHRDRPAGPSDGGRPLNLSSAAILAGIAVDAWLLAFIAIRGRRPWLQATYAACTLAYLALLLARRRSRRADRGWARVRLRTRVPRRGIAGGRESGVPDRARVLRPRGPPIRSLLDRTATRERGDEGGNSPGFRRHRVRGEPSQVCAPDGARGVLQRTHHPDPWPPRTLDGRGRGRVRRTPPGPPRLVEGADDRIRVSRDLPRRSRGRRGPGRSLGLLRVAAHHRGRGPSPACCPRYGIHGGLLDLAAHRCGASSVAGLAAPLVVAPRSGAGNRGDPRPIVRHRCGAPPRSLHLTPGTYPLESLVPKLP